MDVKKEWTREQKELKENRKEAAKIEIDCAEKLKAMMGSPGWQLIEKYLNTEMDIATKNLLNSKDDRDIYYSQAVVNTIRRLFEKIGVSFQEADRASELLRKYS